MVKVLKINPCLTVVSVARSEKDFVVNLNYLDFYDKF